MSTEARKKVVITFHGIGDAPPSMADVAPEMWISRERFEETLQLLTPNVCPTFDDGFGCCWDIAFPELMRLGLTAKFFVIAGYLGTPGYLTVDQLKEMVRSGMLIGTHGMYHRAWRRLNHSGIKEEIFEAKERLEDLLGISVTEAACPFGAYDRRALNALRGAGIEYVYTSDRALPEPNSWMIPRFTIRKSDTHEYVKEVVDGRHDASLLSGMKMLLKRYR